MSEVTPEIVKEVQQILRDAGLYRGEIDGQPGPLTRGAFDALLREVRRPLRPIANRQSPIGNSGAERTDWRGYVPVNVARLAAILPPQARDLASEFANAAQGNDINALFLVAISKHETGAWTSNVFRNKNNAMGISDENGAVRCASRGASIRQMARSLARKPGNYSRCNTVADISKVYAPIGAHNDPTKVNSYWPGLVAQYWGELEAQLA